jgi:hypothetical protein
MGVVTDVESNNTADVRAKEDKLPTGPVVDEQSFSGEDGEAINFHDLEWWYVSRRRRRRRLTERERERERLT